MSDLYLLTCPIIIKVIKRVHAGQVQERHLLQQEHRGYLVVHADFHRLDFVRVHVHAVVEVQCVQQLRQYAGQHVVPSTALGLSKMEPGFLADVEVSRILLAPA